MKQIITRIVSFLIILMCPLAELRVKSFTIVPTTKASLNFEILDAQMTPETLTINGWAFINENQHYETTSDHTIQLEFISLSESFIVTANLVNLSMTSAYEQLGLPYCAADVYYASTCNYNYDYVGFSVSIPLSRFKLGEKYSTNIIVLAHSSQTYLKTPLYYPISNPVQIRRGDYLFSVMSKLNDTQIKIIETPIYARKAPGKAATIWTSGTNCSMTYGNRLYFKIGSTYTSVISRFVTENQTFYELNAKLDVCVEMRRRIVEGSTIIPVWISGMFVEYSGSPLEINSSLINTNPIIIVENPTISVTEQVNLLDYAKCNDLEEGDLSYKIVIETTNFINKPGVYFVTYYVEDKYGYYDRDTANITVVGNNNEPPVINAADRYVNQYDQIDYYDGVTAHDNQDGDITNLLRVLNEIDTSQAVDQVVCYSVTDLNSATTSKCIVVYVFSNIANSSRFRFISKNYLFYLDAVPNQWVGKEFQLQTMLENETLLESMIIN